LVLLFLVIGFIAKAQNQPQKTETLDSIVISATKFSSPKGKIGKSILKITSKDLELKRGKTVVEILNEVAGIEIRGTQSTGGEPKSLYVRGGRSHQTLVLVDGVAVSDPSGVSQNFDLRFISPNQIESIEILKGAGKKVIALAPNAAELNAIGFNMMDPRRRQRVFETSQQQAAAQVKHALANA